MCNSQFIILCILRFVDITESVINPQGKFSFLVLSSVIIIIALKSLEIKYGSMLLAQFSIKHMIINYGKGNNYCFLIATF